LLGIGHEATFPHPIGRPLRVTEGEPLYALLGDQPATKERTTPTGNLALVPAYTEDRLLNTNFEDGAPLIRIGAGKRLKGWHAAPLCEPGKSAELGVALLQAANGNHYAALGFNLAGASTELAGAVKGGAWAWQLVPVYDDGTHGDDVAADGKYTFVLSNFVGAGKQFYHTGLLKTGDQPEWVYDFNGLEYKDTNGAAAPDGITAYVKAAGTVIWTSVPVTLTTGQFVNTRITVP
jgi:hypothetical protein